MSQSPGVDEFLTRLCDYIVCEMFKGPLDHGLVLRDVEHVDPQLVIPVPHQSLDDGRDVY